MEGPLVSVDARMTEARALAARGLHAEALTEFMWCFDRGHLEDPSFGGVRVSFLLGDIADLARVYPAALDELRKRRDAAESRMLAEADDPLSATEFGRLNEKLSETGRSLALFDRLLDRPDRSAAVRELLNFVLPQLVEARR